MRPHGYWKSREITKKESNQLNPIPYYIEDEEGQEFEVIEEDEETISLIGLNTFSIGVHFFFVG